MLQVERQKFLLDVIKEKRVINIKELTEMVSCSQSTLQRDLNNLESLGQIVRSYGGVMYNELPSNELMDRDYLMYDKRNIANHDEKIAIAKKVQSFIRNGDVIYLTHGTTTCQIAKHIPKNKFLTILTDGLDILYELEIRPNIRVLSTGGLVNYSSRQIEHNPYVVSQVNNANINKLIMGIGGLSIENGITFYDYVSFSFLERIMPDIGEIIVVADHTKFGRVALANCVSLEKIDKVITDDKVDKEYIKLLEDKGVELIIAK